MIKRLLACCARQDPLPETTATLEKYLKGFTDWVSLFDRAQFHGMTPLLWHHIQAGAITIPGRQKQLFKLLAFRYRHANEVRLHVLTDILRALRQAEIRAVVLKGWVLALEVYNDIALRPMRDIDLLLNEEDLIPAEQVLSSIGFHAELPHHILRDHHHMVPLFKQVDGISVELELHRRLLPILPQYRQLDFTAVAPDLIHFDCQEEDALSLNYSEMLWYLFMHGFRMPLNYEPFRIMHLADIISLVEKKFDVINWQEMRSHHPEMIPALELFHQFSPFSESVCQELKLAESAPAQGTGGDFRGWPRRRLNTIRKAQYPELLRTTFFPDSWWLRLYYRDGPKRSVLLYWLRHLVTVSRLIGEGLPSLLQNRFQILLKRIRNITPKST